MTQLELRQRGTAHSIVFPMRDGSGNLVSGLTLSVVRSAWDEGATPPNMSAYSVTTAELGAGSGLYRMVVPSADTGFDYFAYKITGGTAVPTVIMVTTRYVAIAETILDRANAIETGITPRQALRIILSALAGKTTGAGTSLITFRNTADTKTRISATIDGAGNRVSVTLDGT